MALISGKPMNNNKLFLDERLVQNICSLCGEVTPDTKEHVIPRVFLEKPFPKELPTTLSCLECNNSYSKDEQYLACLIECVISGSTDPNKIARERISKTLRRDFRLRKMLENKKIESIEGRISFSIDKTRVENVLVKLARTHLFYLINEINLKDPKDLTYNPIINLSPKEKNQFFENKGYLYPEIGTRLFSELVKKNNFNWHIIQDGFYQFLIEIAENVSVKILIRNYLACTITW